MPLGRRILGPVAAMGLSMSPATVAQFHDCEAHVVPAQGWQGMQFGRAVAIEGEWLAAGAPRDEDHGFLAGAVYVYRRVDGEWSFARKLRSPDGELSIFGTSVAMRDGLLIVGSALAERTGTAHLYRDVAGNWEPEAAFRAEPVSVYGGSFGYVVAVDADRVLIGEFAEEVRGSAYLYRRSADGWMREARLRPSDGHAADYFGTAVAIDGDTAVVGAFGNDAMENNTGAAYVFRFDGTQWLESARLAPSEPALSSFFGSEVSLAGSTALVSSHGEGAGVAYVFRNEGDAWVQTARLAPEDGTPLDNFGSSLALRGDLAIIGAQLDDPHGSSSGSAYLFRFDGATWVEETKIVPSVSGDPGEFFGLSVDLDGARVAIGATPLNGGTSELGEAYVYTVWDLLDEDCNCNARRDADDIAGGHSDDVNFNGIPDECEGCLGDLDASGDVGFGDVLAVLDAWGPYEPCPPFTPADLDSDYSVGFPDVLFILARWGPCGGK